MMWMFRGPEVAWSHERLERLFEHYRGDSRKQLIAHQQLDGDLSNLCIVKQSRSLPH